MSGETIRAIVGLIAIWACFCWSVRFGVWLWGRLRRKRFSNVRCTINGTQVTGFCRGDSEFKLDPKDTP